MQDEQVDLIERYHRDSESGVLFRFSAAAGSDDPVSAHVHTVLSAASDLSLFSEELRASWNDLPTQYALSPVRANVLRPFEAFLRADVLEVGAQYGAASRYLAEIGARLVAIEPIPARASAAALRTRDFPSARVICDSLRDFQPDVRFDVVTLLNAAESAAEWASEGGMRAMLKKAASLLRPDGLLIVASENRFGLKYLSSAKDPGRDAPLFSGTGSDAGDDASVFSKTAVLAALGQLDFGRVEVASPFPDHKLTRSLVTPAGFEAGRAFDISVLAAQSASRDPSLPNGLHFAIEPAWRAAGRDGIIEDVANSFIYAARRDSSAPCFAPADLAYHYSTDRRAPFCKVTRFRRTDGIQVERRKLSEGAPDPEDSRFLFIVEDEPFHSGRSFDGDFEAVVSTPGWSVDMLASFFRRFIDMLVAESANRACEVELPVDASTPVAGALLDFIPSNICIWEEAGHPAQRYVAYDLEWRSRESLPLGYMVFRALLNLSGSVSCYAVPSDPTLLNRRTLFAGLYGALGFSFTEADCLNYWERESDFLEFATGSQTSVSAQEWFGSDLPTGTAEPVIDLAQFQAAAKEAESRAGALARRIVELEGQCELYRSRLDANAEMSERLKRVQREFNILSEQYGRRCQKEIFSKHAPEDAQAAAAPSLQRVAALTKRLRPFARLWKAADSAVPPRAQRSLAERAARKIIRVVGARQARQGGVPPANESFDPVFYAEMYGDVAESGMNLREHFVNHGRGEGRLGTPPVPEVRWLEPRREGYESRDTVLVVSHEASRSGAPILAWNICLELRARFNVVGLVLGPGPLEGEFAQACDGLIGPLAPVNRHPVALRYFLHALVEQVPIKFAIVNSIESRFVLKPLAEMFCPTVFLIHEYYAYSKPHNEFDAALQWAARTVFSAKVVQNNALNGTTQQAIARSLIIPQGKSLIPDGAAGRGNANAGADDGSIDDFLRALDITPEHRPFIVLGAGTLHFRKGADLFIATALEVRRRLPGANIRFVWIGRDLRLDPNYTGCLEQQIRDAGPDSPFLLLDEVPYLEEVYRHVDLFYLPSRMDPLPNVSIDAMTVGLPVICFEGGTGIAEILGEDPLLEDCAVAFSDVSAAAEKIVDIFNSHELRDELSRRVREVATRRFQMSAYVAQLVELAEEAADVMTQERLDCLTLASSRDFDERYFVSPVAQVGQTRDDAIREFIRSSVSGVINHRKPVPGFDAQRYRIEHDLGDLPVNDFAHYLRAGRPEGDWIGHVIDFSQETPPVVPPQTLRCAVHIHAHYPELLGDILERLMLNELRFDLFVSTSSEAAAREVEALIAGFDRGAFMVRTVPNRGRDIGPMLTEFASELQSYDLMGHLHTKKSVHVTNPAFVKAWVKFLLENLAGGQYRTADIIASHFARDASLGLIYADDPHAVGWGTNWPFAETLAQKMGVLSLPRTLLSFPVGTMFWARPAAMKPLFDIGLKWTDYPREPLPIDGSMLHAIERLMPSVVIHEGYHYASTYIPGLSR
ncbi:rhamnan synthesis F family protein [Caballeronia sp. GAFFF3]|uniref:rhamnan synthesis F family protein n=1 Tax=Caballeronia sp. GAFFF3 TaxID=2921759 RepID=UPI0020293DEB|nr:rhamnan synthesis F family protein [Caballeronia sp. GAFFF3]